LLARTASALEEIASRLGGDAVAVPCDVTDAGAVTAAARRIRDELGGAPDILVNNAGLFQIKPLAAICAAEFSETIQTNLIAPFLIVREFLPAMYERGRGDVVTIGSIADRNIFPGNGAYAASKYGARALHEVLRAESRGTGVRATLVSPAGVDTALWDGVSFVGTDVPPDRGGMMQPSAVADAVLFAVTRPADVNIDELRLSRS
jgi:NADP-dependent 3-hydroxy acid dehydrogenase YdfG